MPARTLFVGLDAADPSLLQRWSEDGRLPAVRSVTRDAAMFRLSNSLGTIGGGVWQELNTGRSCGRAGLYFPARQLHTGETAMRQVGLDEVDPSAYWTIASEAGKRVAVVDLPHSVAPPELNGVFVCEWGSHDRLWGSMSLPATLLDELRDRHGDYPVWTRPWPRVTTAGCDAHDGSLEQYEQLLGDLLSGIDQKRDLLLDVLGREEWDLFACAFSEGQCCGHQLWHMRDGAAPPGHERLGMASELVLERLDAALGALVDAAGPDVQVFVVASHGFAEPTGGRQLIPEVLGRLGYGSGSGASSRARSKVPPFVRRFARRVLPSGATAALQERVGTLPNPLDSPSTRAVELDGDRCSWIRLNLEGREPHGAVKPGAEADGVLEEIRTELLLLEQPESGERIVATVRTAAETFGESFHPDVPDLIVDFRTDLGVIDSCRSDRVGLVRAPVRAAARRTGVHPPVPSVLWVSAQDLPSPAPSEDGLAVDLAPTILSRLGVQRPELLDGQALLPERAA
jgi:predicted AlkP superfamily phosphohydrolase/phosphomutase